MTIVTGRLMFMDTNKTLITSWSPTHETYLSVNAHLLSVSHLMQLTRDTSVIYDLSRHRSCLICSHYALVTLNSYLGI